MHKKQTLSDSIALPVTVDGYDGMTYRQWAAGMAMQGILASEPVPPFGVGGAAIQAVKAADRLIDELEPLPPAEE